MPDIHMHIHQIVARKQVCTDVNSVVKNVDVSRNQSGVLSIAWAVVRRRAIRRLVRLTRLGLRMGLRLRMGLAGSGSCPFLLQ